LDWFELIFDDFKEQLEKEECLRCMKFKKSWRGLNERKLETLNAQVCILKALMTELAIEN